MMTTLGITAAEVRNLHSVYYYYESNIFSPSGQTLTFLKDYQEKFWCFNCWSRDLRFLSNGNHVFKACLIKIWSF